MKRFCLPATAIYAAVVLAVCMSSTSSASADTITYTATGDFEWIDPFGTGADDLGLDTASFTFEAEFDSTATYVDFGGFLGVVGNSASLTISGASVASSNGTFLASSVALFPEFAGQFFSDSGGSFVYPGVDLTYQRVSEALDLSISEGDTIDVSHFSTDADPTTSFNFQQTSNFRNRYVYEDGSFSASVSVPEPSSAIALLGLLGCCAGFRRRRLG